MRRLILSTICFLIGNLYGYHSMAQSASTKTTVRGRVIDAKDKQAVIGASVLEIDKDNRTISGATTDIDGNFALKVSNLNNRVKVAYIGYITLTEDIKGRTEINFSLKPSMRELNEVVVTSKKVTDNGTGLNIDARNSTISSTTVNAKDLEELSAQSIDQALQGRMPGVDIGTVSGDPGAPMSIRIRGTSSLNGATDPLIVLDGMPFETTLPDDFNFGTADENGYAQLLNVAPTDIKDITVLKDAAATAVWGSRAANGVLIINTKRGAVGKPQISYNFKGSINKQPENIPLLNGYQYASLIPEAYANAGRTPLDIQTYKEFSYDPLDPAYYYNYSNNTNWIDEITKIGYQQDHNISMSGGGEKARYYASVGYLNTQGTTVGTDLKRISAKINLDYNVSSRIRFKTDITYTNLVNNSNYAGNVRGVAQVKMPNMSVYQYTLTGEETPNYFSPDFNIQGTFSLNSKNEAAGTYNPVAFAREAISRQYGNRIIPHFNLQYDLVPEFLRSTFDIQFDVNNSKGTTFLPQIATGRTTGTTVNRASDSDGDSFGVTTKLNFLFSPKLHSERHNLSGLLSFQTSDSKSSSYNALSANTASSLLQDPSIASRTANSDLGVSASIKQSRSLGALAQAQYAFDDKYMFNAGIRLDGSSRFGPGNRYGVFPSISGRWRISGEKFMQKLKMVNELSLRASYGKSGNAPDKDYLYFNQYSPFAYTFNDKVGVYPTNFELTNLKWETVTGTNLGINLGMFKDRLTVTYDVYRKRTSDMFYDKLQIPVFTGYSTLSSNVGTMDNDGWEFGLSTQIIKKKKLLVGFDFNMARNVNIMREVSDYFPKDNGVKLDQNGVYRSYLLIGNPFGSFYGFKYKGVYKDEEATIALNSRGNKIVDPNGNITYMRFNYPKTNYTFQPGDAKYEDINHDGNIDENDIVYLGNGIPKVSGGFGPRFTYKGAWTLSAFFDFKYDYQLINGAAMKTSNMYSFDNQSTVVLKRWRNPGDETDVPRALYGSGYNWLGSDRYVEDASYVRFRQLTLRYNASKNLIGKIGLRSGSIYVTTENLALWTKYKGQNPDVSVRGGDAFKLYKDDALTPPAKNVLMGITIGL